MQVGDLVDASPWSEKANLAVVVAVTNQAVGATVRVIMVHNNTECRFQWQHLEVINASR